MSMLGLTTRLIAYWPFEGVPDPGTGKQPPGFEKFTDVMGWVKWIALGILVIALIAAGVRMAFGAGRGDGGEHAARIGWVLGGVMIVSGAVAIISFLV